MRRRTRFAVLVSVVDALAGCATYRPAPISPATLVSVRIDRRLPASARPWSTAALLAQALDWAPAIRESAANYRSLALTARAARVPLPAALQLTAEYSRDDNPNKPWLGSGILDIPLDLGGRRKARVSAADLAVIQARYDYGEAVWTVRSALARARIEHLIAARLALLADRALALRQDRFDKLQNRVRSGEDARPIGIQAQIDLVNAQRRVRDVAARSVQSDVALATALGVDRAAVTGLVLEPLSAPLPTATATNLANWRMEAAAGRRDLLKALIDYDLAENNVRLEVANQYPALRIQPGYTYERGLVKLPFGLNLLLPPVDLNRANIAAAEAKRAQAGARLETVQATILGDVDRTAAALDAQRIAERTTASRDLPLARRLAATATASLRAGETDRVDEDAARASAIDAEIALIEAIRLAWLAIIDFEDAFRRPMDAREGVVLETAMTRLGDGR